MAVAYAWKIDSTIYSYIVNPNYLDDDSSLIASDPDEYMGYVSVGKVSDTDNAKIKEFSKNKFASGGDVEYTNYTIYFNHMMDKIWNYSPDGSGGSHPYVYVDLLSAENYFNIDSECSSIIEESYECVKYNPNDTGITESNRLSSTTMTMPVAVGGINSGTTLGSLSGLSYNELFNLLLFPELYPTAPVLPTLKVTLKNVPSLYIIKWTSGGGAEGESWKTLTDKYLITDNANSSYTKGKFSGNGYTINTAVATYATTTAYTPTEFAEDILDVPNKTAVTYTTTLTYSAPSNKPQTNRGNECDDAAYTWIAGSITKKVTATIVVASSFGCNFIPTTASTGEYTATDITDYILDEQIYPTAADQKEFIINYDTTEYPLMIDTDRLSKIEEYNELTRVWDEQTFIQEGDTYTLVQKSAGKYKITLSKSLNEE